MIDIRKTYKTRDGRPVELLTTSARGSLKWPVMGYIGDHVNLTFWSPEGIQDINGRRSNLDLVEVMPKRVMWLNVYPGGLLMHDSREDADKRSAETRSVENRIARIKVEFEEGQFDE